MATGRKVTYNREALASLRRLRGKSFAQFAKPLRRSGTAVQEWERGNTSPTAEDLARICTAHDADPAAFFTVAATK